MVAIDTFVFDLGGVLIDWDPRYVYRQLLPTEEAVERFLAEVCNHDWNRRMDAGRPFAEGIAELVERFPEQAPLIRAYRERWPEMLGGPLEETVRGLAALREGGYRLFAVTNWSAETFAIAREMYDFLGWFRYIAVSGELRIVKPDPRILRHLMQQCSVDPARSVFIDDIESNVAAAARLGFATHHFRSPEGFRAQLAEWGFPAG